MDNNLAQLPEIDISVVTYNSSAWLDAFMDSLVDQRFPLGNIRLLFRDNGSGDDTRARLEALAAEHRPRFKEILLDFGKNVGFGRGHNANLVRAASPWFLVTNVDLELEPDTLHELVQRAAGDPPDVALWECRQKPYEHPKHYRPDTGETLWSSSACALFRTEALRRIGGYEPKLFLYGEDVEISYRLRDRGWTLRYVPRATVWHHTYQAAGELKPAQYFGNTLANVLLRCRYGTAREVLRGFLLYLSLFLEPRLFPHQRIRLARRVLSLFWLAPYFLLTRKRSDIKFRFLRWDYELTRHGAFYPQPRLPPETERPLVSVLVRTMAGRGGKLAEAVASVAQQTYRPVELVIVEDGSDTAAAFAQAQDAAGRFAAVRYRALPKMGRCAAGNAALGLALSADEIDYLVDSLLYADHLETLVDALQAVPEASGAYGLAFEVRTEIQSHDPWRYRELDFCLRYRQPFSRALLWHHNFMPIQCVLFRRELFDRHGGFDPELDNLEDWNLWVRYTLQRDFIMVDKLTSLYRVPAEPAHALARQTDLDDYYAKATAKHAELRVALSPPQVVDMARELAPHVYVAPVPPGPLRQAVLARPWLLRLYAPIRHARILLAHARGRL